MLCVFKGRHINLNRTQCYYYLFSHHTYKMQVCRVDLQLEQFARDNVELVPDTMELLTDTELTQYFIQTWSLAYNDQGAAFQLILLILQILLQLHPLMV